MSSFWFLTLAVLLLAGCRKPPAPAAAPTGTQVDRPAPAVTYIPPLTVAPPSPVEIRPTVTPFPEPTETAEPTPLPATPHPLFPYTIAGLRQRDFLGGPVQVRTTLEQNDSFTQYYIDYPSDDLSITGLMYVPAGEGPFPTLILLHGYIDRDQYFAGADTWQAAEYFARHGYLVLAPDLRSWGESDTGLSLFHTGLVADVLNLISSLPSVQQADPTRVGLWGHSMGGGVATKVLTIDDRVKAAVLYAPNSANDADLLDRWGAGCLPGQSEAAGDHCNPAEIIPPDTPPDLIEAYLTYVGRPDLLQQVAPLYHLEAVTAPVQIHIGDDDGQSLVETPTEWSATLAEAMMAANRDVTRFTYAGEGHSFFGQGWVTLLDRALAFFDQHLKGDLSSPPGVRSVPGLPRRLRLSALLPGRIQPQFRRVVAQSASGRPS